MDDKAYDLYARKEAIKHEVGSLLLLREMYQRFLNKEIDHYQLTNSIVAHCNVYGGDPLSITFNL
ncbi:hypothetical protein Blue_165 [Bacillus phage Deep Blue]|uniref:Uncharacterized protein n=1 Tax=Bacillus phage Deep Blue TaxID=1792245 RepID=A0A140HLX6_9CAUD|nr:hypothetical protein Blue_165 [Bacillus phage Deep Blue]AMO25988.1 hypothetical protein Blue_165 [Bacillus phage Deep Blue]